jgi:hypothetical protein
MARALVSTVLTASADAVWDLVGDFNAWDRFVPRIESSRLEGGVGRGPVGSVRILGMADGSTVRERLVSYDEAERRLAYKFDFAHCYPVWGYIGRVQVVPVTTTGGSFVMWRGDFDADQADQPRMTATFEQIYRSFLSSLADIVEVTGSAHVVSSDR